jgi:hypothetical protein
VPRSLSQFQQIATCAEPVSHRIPAEEVLAAVQGGTLVPEAFVDCARLGQEMRAADLHLVISARENLT